MGTTDCSPDGQNYEGNENEHQAHGQPKPPPSVSPQNMKLGNYLKYGFNDERKQNSALYV